MARPRSDDKREAIIEAAIDVIAAEGLSASTAAIARTAGVATGSLFTYFGTKAELLNAAFVTLKLEMATASGAGLDPDGDTRSRLQSAWTSWLAWAAGRPERRRVLAVLSASDEITAASRQLGHNAMAPFARLVESARLGGAMRNSELSFVFALLNAAVEATIDCIAADPANAEKYSRDGFEAAWRMIA